MKKHRTYRIHFLFRPSYISSCLVAWSHSAHRTCKKTFKLIHINWSRWVQKTLYLHIWGKSGLMQANKRTKNTKNEQLKQKQSGEHGPIDIGTDDNTCLPILIQDFIVLFMLSRYNNERWDNHSKHSTTLIHSTWNRTIRKLFFLFRSFHIHRQLDKENPPL